MAESSRYSGSLGWGGAGETDEPLLWFGGAGHEVRTSGAYFYDARKRPDGPHVVLQLSLAGAGFYRRAGGSRVALGRGKAWIDQIPGSFEYGWEGGRHELVFVSFRGGEALRWMKQVHALHGPVLEFGSRADEIAQSMLGLVRAARTDPPAGDRYLMSGRLYGLVMQVLSELSRTRVEESALAARAMKVVEARAVDPGFNVAALARELDCSREHLAREFRRAVGVSPVEFVRQARIRLAARTLRGGERKLEVIARDSGFRTSQYFCRVFRRATGVTPGQFRERGWLVVP